MLKVRKCSETERMTTRVGDENRPQHGQCVGLLATGAEA